MKKEKQELIAWEINNYNIDVCCHKETQIKRLQIKIGVRQHNSFENNKLETFCFQYQMEE